MNKKIFLGLLALVLLVAVFIGGALLNQDEPSESFDTAFYVESTSNVFIKIAKAGEKLCYYIVDIVVGGISTIFINLIG